MCELLIKVAATTANQATTYQQNDVVTIQPDGHAWSQAELDTSIFAVVKFPNTPVQDMQFLLSELQEPLPQTAAMRIPALRKALSNQYRPTKILKRYNIDPATKQIIDKARI